MSSVSTLVASCTGLAISTVGLVLGRQEPQPQGLHCPPASLNDHNQPRRMSAPLLYQYSSSADPGRHFRSSIDSADSVESSLARSPSIRYTPLAELPTPLQAAEATSDTSRRASNSPASPRLDGVARSFPAAKASQGLIGDVLDESMKPDRKRREQGLHRSITSSSIARLRRPGLSNRPASMILQSGRNKSIANDAAKPLHNAGNKSQDAPGSEHAVPSKSSKAFSRLPIPNFRKISGTRFQQRPSTSATTNIASEHEPSNRTLSPNTEIREQTRWRNFFTPRESPNAVRKIVPHSSYRPVLLSGAEPVLANTGKAAEESTYVPRESNGKRYFSAPVATSRGPVPGRSPSISRLASKITSQKRSSRQSLLLPPTVNTENESDIVTKPMTSSSTRSKRSSLLLGLRQISHNRVSSAPAYRTDNLGVAVRDFTSPTLSSQRRSDANTLNTLNPPKRRERAARTSSIGVSPRSSILRPSSASTVGSSLRDFSHTPTIDSILSPSRPTSATEQSCAPSSNKADVPHRDFRSLSDVASSTAESDMDVASLADDYGFSDADDAMYDSVRTRATSTSSALRATDIDKLFVVPAKPANDETPTQERRLSGLVNKTKSSMFEEEESNASTPVRRTRALEDPQSALSLRAPSSRPDETFPEFGDWDMDEQDGNPVLVELSPLTIPDNSQPRLSSSSDVKSNIFDWAEQKPLDTAASTNLARPMTVHGKKAFDARGGRSSGRRIATGIHARSQSVPVAAEIEGKRSQAVSAKFGTWGVGSKGATEDWNEDFDFDFGPAPVSAVTVMEPQLEEPERLDSATVMVIPSFIKEQQSSVMANIGLLREWGLLIEELKELRGRATTIGLRPAQAASTDMWHDVDAMIDLADHESQDQTLAPGQSSPPSPNFNAAAFNDPVPDDLVPLPRPLESDTALESPSASPTKSAARIPGRPRKDSEAVARSVIEALQQKRNISDPTSTNISTTRPSKKVPFDTATLRRIVPYVQELRDRVKLAICKAEGLYDSSEAGTGPLGDQAASRVIVGSGQDSPGLASMARNSLSDDGSGSCSSPEGLASRVSRMTVV